MSRAGLAIAALAAVLAAGPARAYVRSTDTTTGACLYWGSRSISFRVNVGHPGTNLGAPAPVSPTCSPTGEPGIVQQAFDQWTGASQSCTDLNLVFDPTPGSTTIGYVQGGQNENTIVFRVGWCTDTAIVPANDPCWSVDLSKNPGDVSKTCANVYNCFDDVGMSRATLALTTVTYNQTTGQIFDADTEYNAWDGVLTPIPPATPIDAWYYTCTDSATKCTSYGQNSCIYIDLQNTATHEAGHFIGLAHTPVATATMYAYASPGDVAKRILAPDDVSGLCAIYPAGQATVTCVPAQHHSGGCAAGGEGALPAILFALAALAPRLRLRRRC